MRRDILRHKPTETRAVQKFTSPHIEQTVG